MFHQPPLQCHKHLKNNNYLKPILTLCYSYILILLTNYHYDTFSFKVRSENLVAHETMFLLPFLLALKKKFLRDLFE